jgi:hypothetical protein
VGETVAAFAVHILDAELTSVSNDEFLREPAAAIAALSVPKKPKRRSAVMSVRRNDALEQPEIQQALHFGKSPEGGEAWSEGLLGGPH